MRWIEDNVINAEWPFWTRANVGEVLPEPPSPLGWDLVWEQGVLPGWRHCAINRLGFGDDEVSIVRPEVVGLFGGYAYLGATLTRVWAERTEGMSADAVDAAYYGDHPDVPPYVAQPWHERAATTEHMNGWLAWVLGSFDQSELLADRDTAEAARASRPDLSQLSNEELLARARSFLPDVLGMFSQHINQSAAASIGPGIVAAVADAMGDPTLTLKIIGGLGDVDSAAPSYAMWQLSRRVRGSDTLNASFDQGHQGLTHRLHEAAASGDADASALLAELDDFLLHFGSRGPNEWDIYSPVWETEPDLVMAAIDRMRLADDDAAPVASHAEREAEREALVAQVTEALAADPEAQGQFQAGVMSAKTFVPGRERAKTSIIKIIHEIRMALFELGGRMVDAGGLDRPRDIAMLFDDELQAAAADPASVHDLVVGRLAHHAHLQTVDPPFIIYGTVPPPDTWGAKADHTSTAAGEGEIIAGMPGCSGTYRGTARIVLDPSDPSVLGPGEILIAPHTDPAWTPLFVAAGAVVVNVGAALSHAIIVSRELGIPCVVSATDATMRIRDGATVEVNGDTGEVTVVVA